MSYDGVFLFPLNQPFVRRRIKAQHLIRDICTKEEKKMPEYTVKGKTIETGNCQFRLFCTGLLGVAFSAAEGN